jgi:hypothetical protein
VRELGRDEVSLADRSRGLKAETDPDVALKTAIKVAVDAGMYDRAAKLLDVLRSTPPLAEIVSLQSESAPSSGENRSDGRRSGE